MEKIIAETNQLLNIKLSPHQVSQLKHYQQELEKWNEHYSLTAIRDPEKVRVKHFLDSFSCRLVMDHLAGKRIIDIGTGAGFPGLPLKILSPETGVTVVDSVKKKVEFCQHIVKKLDLDGVGVIRERAERLGQDLGHREQYDWAVARAVAQLPELAEYLLPLVKRGGFMLAMKGESGPAEAQQSMAVIDLLGGELSQVKKLTLPGVAEDRYLIVVQKMVSTPEKFPRRVGIPSKRPLHSTLD